MAIVERKHSTSPFRRVCDVSLKVRGSWVVGREILMVDLCEGMIECRYDSETTPVDSRTTASSSHFYSGKVVWENKGRKPAVGLLRRFDVDINLCLPQLGGYKYSR
jgi:hypothetical protein